MFASIYSHKDYRAYLKDFYLKQKRANASYSFRKFSEKGQIGSPNLLKLVMDGKKNLSTVTILKFSKALGLNQADTEFFEALVLENQATDPSEKKFYSKRIQSLLSRHSSKTMQLFGKTVVFDHVLVPALVVYLAGKEIEKALASLEKYFPFSKEEVLRWIHLLETEQALLRKEGKFQIDFEHAIFTRKPSDLKLRTKEPPPQVFEWVRDQVKKLNYSGYDLIACTSTTGDVVLGGSFFWNAPMRIFYVEKNAVISSVPLSKDTEIRNVTKNFKLKDRRTLHLNLSENEKATISFDHEEIALLVNCYLSLSGLE